MYGIGEEFFIEYPGDITPRQGRGIVFSARYELLKRYAISQKTG